MSVDSSSGKPAGPEAQGDSEPPIDRMRRRRLLADCREMLVDRMSVVIHEALEKMSEELTALALKKFRADEQQALLEAVSMVRTSGADIESQFRRAFVQVFERRLFSRDVAPTEIEANPDELRLVDDSVVDSELEVERLVRRARSKLDPDEVLGMRARLAALVERDWFDENRHPASPEAIFEALREALDTLGSEPSVKSALLDAFEPYVSANLNLVYSNVNERLRSNRILPKIRPRVQVVGTERANGDEDAAAELAGLADASAPLGSAVPAGGGTPARAGAMGGAGATGGAFGEGGLSGDAFERLARQVAAGDASARSSAVRMLSNPEHFGVADLPVPTVEPPLLDALNAMQPAVGRSELGSKQLFDELGEHARSKGSALDQLTVEIVSLVFDYIYNDRRLADAVKQQLLRLQVVAVKAALLDRSFFARRQHPMRRLIDAITELSTDPDSEASPGSPLVTGLAELIDWVLEHFDRDLSIFEDAIRRLEVLEMAEAERRVVRLQEITRNAEREEAIARAREEAREEIESRLDEGTPEFIAGFLTHWWTEVLIRARVDGTESGLEWQRALRLAEHLLWSAAPKGPEEIPRLATMLPQLINGLLKGLQVANPPGPERETFFNELLAWHTQSIAQAKKATESARQRARAPIRLHEDGSVEFHRKTNLPPPPEARLEPSVVDGLARGCLLDYEDGEQTLRVKLAWVSPSRTLFALSRYPDFARSLSRAELAAMFEAGAVRVAPDASPLDQAIESVAEDGTREVAQAAA